MEKGLLKDLNLKEGDVVEVVETGHGSSSFIGTRYTAKQGEYGFQVYTDAGKWNVINNPDSKWVYKVVSRANSGPVRTVTRKKIVPGIYGAVRVREDGRVSTLSVRGAEALTQTINTLTLIRDAMQEKGQ